jgi:photosystem II stability/assembly factor-like uncharacterized protein
MQVLFLFLLLMVTAHAAAQTKSPSGTPWEMQNSTSTASLRGIDSVDGTVAWASGTEGTVLRTSDGGAHWRKCAVPDAEKDGATLDLRGIQAWDMDTAVVMASGPGDKSRLYETVDGCKTWTLLLKNPDAPKGFFDSFQIFYKGFHNGDPTGYGLVLGDPVGGRFTLFEINITPYSSMPVDSKDLIVPAKNSAAFSASNSVLVDLYKGTYGFITGGPTAANLVRVRYGEGTWKEGGGNSKTLAKTVRLPLATGTDSSGAFAIAKRILNGDSDSATVAEVTVGGDYAKPDDGAGSAAWSDDGGEHWTASTVMPHGYRSSVQWSDDLSAWVAVGANGSDISHDDGKTWQALDNGNWNAVSLPFVVGSSGRIARLNPAKVPADRSHAVSAAVPADSTATEHAESEPALGRH